VGAAGKRLKPLFRICYAMAWAIWEDGKDRICALLLLALLGGDKRVFAVDEAKDDLCRMSKLRNGKRNNIPLAEWDTIHSELHQMALHEDWR